MPLLSGPLLAISALLAVAGVMKLIRPQHTAGALRASSLPAGEGLVRLLGLAEVAVGLGAVVFGGTGWAVGVAIFYLGFALFVINALRSGAPIASCGCFGSPDTPPTLGHVVLDLVAAAVALAVALDPVGPWAGLPADSWSATIAFLLFSGATVYLLYAIVEVLPRRPARETMLTLSPTRGPIDE